VSLSSRDKILLIAVMVAAVLGGGWYFLIRPAQSDVSAKQDQLTAVESEVGQRRDELTRLSEEPESHTTKTVERLWLAKAVPVGHQTEGAVVELQRLADRSGVELAAVRTVSRVTYGPLEGTQYELDVIGRFYNVDDFLYRVHEQVALDKGDSPDIDGRLFATIKVDMGLEAQLGSGASPGTQLAPNDVIRATVTVVAFNEGAGQIAPAGGGTTTVDPAVGSDPSEPAGATPSAPAPDPAAGGSGSGGTTTAPSGEGGSTTAPAEAGQTTTQGSEAPPPGDAGTEQTTAQPGGGGTTQ
jgi:hypothetical protein